MSASEPAGLPPKVRWLPWGLWLGYAWLRLSLELPVPVTLYPDSGDYLRIAQRAWGDPLFWIGVRPAGVPLLYRLVGAAPEAIGWLQLLASIAAWGVLAWAVLRAARTPLAGLLSFGVVLAFSLGLDILRWDRIVLSESLSLSLLALVLAAWLWLMEGWSWGKAAALLTVSALWMLARETNTYLGALLGVGLGAGVLLRRVRARWGWVAAGLLVCFAGFQGLSNRGERWVFPFFNVLAQRILPDAHKVAFFQQFEMPVSPALLEMAGKWAHSDDFALYNAESLRGFQSWAAARGKSTYLEYLLADPLRTAWEPLQNADVLLFPTLRGYTPQGLRGLPVDGLYPQSPWAVGGLAVLGALCWGAAWARWRRLNGRGLWAALALLLLSYPHLALVWHGDAMEVGRHALAAGVQLRLGLWLALLFGLQAYRWGPEPPQPAGPDQLEAAVAGVWAGLRRAETRPRLAAWGLGLVWAQGLAAWGLHAAQGGLVSRLGLVVTVGWALLLGAAGLGWAARRRGWGRPQKWRVPTAWGAAALLTLAVGAGLTAWVFLRPLDEAWMQWLYQRPAGDVEVFERLRGLALSLRWPLLWVGAGAAQVLGLWIVACWEDFRQAAHTGSLGRAALILGLGGLTLAQAAVLVLRLEVFLTIPGWKWYFAPRDLPQGAWLGGALLAAGLTACVGWAGRSSPWGRRAAWAGLVVLAAAGQWGLGAAAGGTPWAVQEKFASAADAQELFDSLRGEDPPTHLAPLHLPGAARVYRALEAPLQAADPLEKADERAERMRTVFTWLMPLLAGGAALLTAAWSRRMGLPDGAALLAGALLACLPAFLLTPLFMEQWLLPGLALGVVWCGLRAAEQRQPLWAAAAAGLWVWGLSISLGFAALGIAGAVWWFGLGPARRWRLGWGAAAGAAGMTVLLAISGLPLGQALAESWAALTQTRPLGAGLGGYWNHLRLNLAELAVWNGLPLMGLALVRLWNARRARQRRLDFLALGAGAAVVTADLLTWTRGSAQFSGLYLAPFLAFMAADQIYRSFPARKAPWVGAALAAAQILLTLLIFQAHDFYN
ncbi:hypothetical protein [Levilinea saccharolytica]|uniref:Uncharacterized protein n=3 Tax=Levilinea saccharolytica TaxID=229921 RepID=A0A0P6YQE8_9CHLR|nr:hypothetical protein [Levilinea saccharolytica]KPL87398.1 hypothetical protein ADN01_04310 [Levilinea saccharolytica]